MGYSGISPKQHILAACTLKKWRPQNPALYVQHVGAVSGFIRQLWI